MEEVVDDEMQVVGAMIDAHNDLGVPPATTGPAAAAATVAAEHEDEEVAALEVDHETVEAAEAAARNAFA